MPDAVTEIPFAATLLDGDTRRAALQAKLGLVHAFRAHSSEHGDALDRFFIHRVGDLSGTLRRAQANIDEVTRRLAEYEARPLHPARYLYSTAAHDGVRHVVGCAGGPTLALQLHSSLSPERLAPGDRVLLAPDRNLILAVCGPEDGRASAAAEFIAWERPDRSLVRVRRRDEVMILLTVAALRADTLRAGDLVGMDEELGLALARLERREDERFLLQAPPDVPPGAIGGLDEAYAALLLALTKRLSHADAAARLGALHKPPSVLLCGPSGCGKTLLTKAATAELNRRTGGRTRFGYVAPGAFESKWVGETQQRIRAVFAALRAADHAVLFLDEIDSIGAARGHQQGYHHDRFLTALLAELDGYVGDGHRACVVAATNKPEALDPALLGRFGSQITVPRPNRAAAARILDIHLPPADTFTLGAEARTDALERALHRLYAPTDDALVARVTFVDGKQAPLRAGDVVTGRLLSDACEQTKDRALARIVRGTDSGVRVEDLELGLESVLEQVVRTLRPGNAHQHVTLPDKPLSSVTPLPRRVKAPSGYLVVTPREVAA